MATEEHSADALALLALSNMRGVGFETLKGIAKSGVRLAHLLSPDAMDRERSRRPADDKQFHRAAALAHELKLSPGLFDKARHQLEYLRDRRVEVVFPEQRGFPQKLLGGRDAPMWLFVEGSLDALSMPLMTAVGSRKVSADGHWLAQYFGYCIAEMRLATVSGLAEGVDQIVHGASVAAGVPTVAVLGTGILADYPRTSPPLRTAIVEAGGAVVTEYLPTDQPNAKNFVRRNAIQARLGQALLPIEWSRKSGTAHTVRFAYESNRPLLFIRTPTQPSFDWVPAEYRQVGSFSTLPFQHDRFARDIASAMRGEATQPLLI